MHLQIRLGGDSRLRNYKAYFSTEMVRKTTVGVEDGKVRAAHVADTKLLVAGRSRGIGELLQFALEEGTA